MPQTQKVLCYFVNESLPEDPGNGSLASLIREYIARALSQGIEPASLPNTAVRRAVDLPLSQLNALTDLGARCHGMSPGRIAGGLLLALHRRSKTSLSFDHQTTVAPIVTDLREAQAAAVQTVAPHLKSGRLALVEAGTGSGKSRIIAHLAAYVLALRDSGHQFKTVPLLNQEMLARPWSPNSPAALAVAASADRRRNIPAHAETPHTVLISAPTVANLMHLIVEYERVAPTIDPNRAWTIGVVLGRGQFVSQSAVHEIISNQEAPDPAVARWASSGFPAGSNPNTAFLKRMYPGICALADDLRTIATDFPVEDALLAPTHSEQDHEWYAALREIAVSCDIVAVTHSMLANDSLMQRHGVTVLPAPMALFLDEAHAFEEAQADAASSAISLFHLRITIRNTDWRSVRMKGVADLATNALDEAYRALQDIDSPLRLPVTSSDSITLRRAWAHATSKLALLNASLGSMLKSLQAKDLKDDLHRKRSEINAASVAISMLLRGAQGSLGFSPARRYPHILVGPSSVDRLLATRWDSTPCGALLSGTLLYPSLTGPQAGPTIKRLALPPERTVAPVVIHPHWIKSTPLMFTPIQSDASLLAPPVGDSVSIESISSWMTNVAKVIADRIAPTAAGGTLVLLTGYDRLRILEKSLQSLHGGELTSRLMSQDAHELPLSQAISEFKRRSLSGGRPVWLGLGGAWTGIDLSDQRYPDTDAYLDSLLTDLVIPALPFGLNRTTTHESRKAWAGFSVEKDVALRAFLQGLGRLIRRDGLRNRRIWVLDGRLLLPLHRASTSEFMRVIQSYPMRREFDVPQ